MVGRIRGLSASVGKFRRDVSCLVEEFFGSTRFDPCSEADDGFGILAKPVSGICRSAKRIAGCGVLCRPG